MEKPKLEGEKIIENELKDIAKDVASEISEMRENPRLTISTEEINAILQMDEQELAEFFDSRDIDFSKPVLLETPRGVAEPWMNSPEDVRKFLVKSNSN